MTLLAAQAVTACASHPEPLVACLKGLGGEARLPYARVVKGGGEYLMEPGMGSGDMNGQLDKTYLIQFGIYGTEEQVDLIIETLEDLWLKVSDTYYQALQDLGGWALLPVNHNHPVLFAPDSQQDGVLTLKLYLRRSYQ